MYNGFLMPTIHVNQQIQAFLDERNNDDESYSDTLERLLPVGEDVAVTVDETREVVRDEVKPEALQ